MHDRGACVARGVHGRGGHGGFAWQGGMCGRGNAWHGGMCGRGCMLGSGVCMAGGMHGGGGVHGRMACVAGVHAWRGVCVEGGEPS